MTEQADQAPHADSASPGFFHPPLAAAVNHVLGTAAWARQRLQPHAGKTVRFELAPFALALRIVATGEVDDARAGDPVDARFTLTPGTALRVLGADEHAWRQVRFDGDPGLARDILYLAQNLRWDVEEDLSRVFGDLVAHRLVRAGSGFLRWQRAAATQLARSGAAYWTQEQPLIAIRDDIERFAHDVDSLRDDVERAEKRLHHLLSRRSAG